MVINLAGLLGNLFAFGLIVAPVDTMIKIKRDNSVGERSVYNYVGTWANAVAWVGYSAPSQDWFIAGINVFGMFAEFFYTYVYYRYAEGRAKRIAWWAMAGELGWAILMLIIYFAAFFGGRNEEVRRAFFGTIAAVTAVIMYGAMFPDMCAVLRTHDMAQQSILLLVASLGNCASWTAFGVKPLDRAVLVANSIGIALTGFQSMVWVSAWFVFVHGNAAPQQPPPPNDQQQLNHNEPPPPNGQQQLNHDASPPNGQQQLNHDVPPPNDQQQLNHDAPPPNGQQQLNHDAPPPNDQQQLNHNAPPPLNHDAPPPNGQQQLNHDAPPPNDQQQLNHNAPPPLNHNAPLLNHDAPPQNDQHAAPQQLPPNHQGIELLVIFP